MGDVALRLVHGHADDAGSGPGVRPKSDARFNAHRLRIVDGALRCIAAQGVAKTTLDDVAREARCSRATVYRVFPGGKEAVLSAVVDTEVSRFFSSLAVEMGRATDIEDVLVYGMTEAARRITSHGGLVYLLEHEPEIVLPHLAFSHMDTVLFVSSTFIAPFLGRWLDHEEAQRVAEWASRVVLSYLACPAESLDLTDTDSVRDFVRQFVLPGVDSRSDPGNQTEILSSSTQRGASKRSKSRQRQTV